jgi:ABC-type Mn2+/Zn2+ transport system ATPase subunit
VSFIERNARPVSRERLSIRFDSISVGSMGRSIISDVSLTVERRVMNILAGPTLAGKTTIVRLIAGLKVAALNVASPVRQGKSYRPRSRL